MARKDSPMIIGVQDHAAYLASDVPAILKYTRNVYYIGNLEMARDQKRGDHVHTIWMVMRSRKSRKQLNGMQKRRRKRDLNIS